MISKEYSNSRNITDGNEAALVAYIDKIAEAQELIDHIGLYIEDHGEIAPDDVKWSHYGSMADNVAILKEMKDRIRGTGEYAIS